MKYGAYYKSRRKEIVWFRTGRSMETGYYHRHSRRGEPPDVYLSESVPDLIMKSNPWIRAEQEAFEHEASSPGVSAEGIRRTSDNMTEDLIQRLDPYDDAAWVDEPRWVKHLKPDTLSQ